MTSMIDDIRAQAIPRQFPDGEDYLSISVQAVAGIAMNSELPGRKVEAAALKNGVVPERYVRNMKSYSHEDQIRLLHSDVTVVGMGGLGGAVAEILAREGVGTLRLIDGDRFEESNLNRQMLSSADKIGKPKAAAAAERVSCINPSVSVRASEFFLDAENAPSLIKSSDGIIDCLDNLQTRFLLESAAKKAKIPIVSAAIAGETGHVTTIYPDDPGLSLIYGPPEQAPEKGIEQSLGCLSHAVTILSSLECSEMIKILLKRQGGLRDRLLVMDLSDTSFEMLQLS